MTKFTNTISLRLTMIIEAFSLETIQREEGQTLAEYALILTLIAVVVVAAVVFLGGRIGSLFSNIASSI